MVPDGPAVRTPGCHPGSAHGMETVSRLSVNIPYVSGSQTVEWAPLVGHEATAGGAWMTR